MAGSWIRVVYVNIRDTFGSNNYCVSYSKEYGKGHHDYMTSIKVSLPHLGLRVSFAMLLHLLSSLHNVSSTSIKLCKQT